jgi:hypothetical protein
VLSNSGIGESCQIVRAMYSIPSIWGIHKFQSIWGTLTILTKCGSQTSVHLPALSLSFTFRLPWHVCERSKYKKRIEWNVGLGCSNIEKFVIWSVFILMLVLGSHFSLGFPDSELPPKICHRSLLFINIISSSLWFPLPILWSLRVSTCLPSWQNLTVQFWECTLNEMRKSDQITSICIADSLGCWLVKLNYAHIFDFSHSWLLVTSFSHWSWSQ